MGRYIRDVELHLPASEVEEAMQEFLRQESFYQVIWKEKLCWSADMIGADDYLGKNLKRVYFLVYSYANGVLHLEAWMRDGKKSESDMINISSYAQKQSYLDKLIHLENNFIEKLPKDGELYEKNRASLVAIREKSNKAIKKRNLLITICLVILMVLYFIVYHV